MDRTRRECLVSETEKRRSIFHKARTTSLPAMDKAKRELEAEKGRTSMGNILSEAHLPSFTFGGILAARRLTKNLKERTALKLAAKTPTTTKIINEQVPAFSSKPPQKFCTLRAQEFLEKYLPDKLRPLSYNPAFASRLSKEMSDEIKEFVKGTLPARYKLVCIVTLGEANIANALLSSRALWDSHADTFVSHSYESGVMFCVASIFAVYCE
ncbi:dynein light chain Tctex-type 5-like [Scyliorhinus torazame]|uniref:dynein light chain Tctex-type 5-like n=1 Tax=Scyliorhinus torazame TaxID=75743 RepID=UPI003B5C27B5